MTRRGHQQPGRPGQQADLQPRHEPADPQRLWLDAQRQHPLRRHQAAGQHAAVGPGDLRAQPGDLGPAAEEGGRRPVLDGILRRDPGRLRLRRPVELRPQGQARHQGHHERERRQLGQGLAAAARGLAAAARLDDRDRRRRRRLPHAHRQRVFLGNDHHTTPGSAILCHATAADTTKPAVNGRNPVAGAVGVAKTSGVGLSFTDNLKPWTINATNLPIRVKSTQAVVDGYYSYQLNIVNFRPSTAVRREHPVRGGGQERRQGPGRQRCGRLDRDLHDWTVSVGAGSNIRSRACSFSSIARRSR